MKTNIFYAMNEIDDKYILEAAQCLEHKNTGRNYRSVSYTHLTLPTNSRV